MKLPTSTKPSSGFHICDILELNKDKQVDSNQNHEQKSNEDDSMGVKTENVTCDSIKRRHSPSPPTSPSESPPEPSRDVKELKKLKKHLRHENEMTADRQLLSDTIHQYPHLFQNHPAMRPWFNSNGKHTINLEIQFSLAQREISGSEPF